MLRLAFVILLAALPAVAQTITGTITGSVVDPSGLPLAGAPVTLRSETTGLERKTATTTAGDFAFPSLQPGAYTIRVEQQGFKSLVKTGVALSASETLSVGALALEVGAVVESVTVSAEAAAVQTASAERAGLITSSQVENLTIRSRNITSLLQLLPGVVDTNEAKERMDRSFGSIYALGNRSDTNNFSVDGMSLNAIGNNQNSVVNISQDAVAEVKVLLSNYQAEYGRMSGANIQIVTKSGTREFHGLGSWFRRHEQFNANNFFNNRLGARKPRYRYHTLNYNIGGPVALPGGVNRNRDKLFFFWNQEYWPLDTPQAFRQLTVPTELERSGDYSQSLDQNNRLIPVRDPAANAPFPGNRVPASRLDPNGQALLKVFPMPNFFDRAISAGRYNYLFQGQTKTPQRMETLKIDSNINSNNLLSGSFNAYSDVQEGPILTSNWAQINNKIRTPGRVFQGRYQRIFSPTLVNELSAGFSYRPEIQSAAEEEIRRNQRDTVGFRTGQFFPQNNPLNLIPNATFGGVLSPATLSFEGRTLRHSKHRILTINDTISKNLPRHMIKAGLYIDRVWTYNPNPVAFNGTIDFGRNVNSPLDTGYAYSNAAIGVFNSYTETSARLDPLTTAANTEWFLQDNWRVSKRLTLDFGLRFYWIAPINQPEGQVSGFVPSRFDPAKQPRLLEPRMVDGRRVAVHPVTGAVYNASLVGALAPNTGDITNGVVVPARDREYPTSLVNNRGVHYAPRIGFALDPFADGKTAIRGGFGIFYNRTPTISTLFNMTSQKPLVTSPVINFGTLATLLGSSGLFFPEPVIGLDRAGHVPTVMNYSLSVQRNIGGGTVVDVGYVGSLGRHLMWQRDLNSIPFGSNFSPANADPTNPRVPLPQAFLRPATGYTDISFREWASSSNYHSMQVNVTRRFHRGLQFGGAWTWSKALDFNDDDRGGVSVLVSPRVWNYGLAAFDRTHVARINWLWDVPAAKVSSAVARMVVNGWQLSGIASFVSGQPMGVGYSTTTPLDITGSPTDGARIVVTDNPVLPKSERTFSRNFRTDVFALPARGTIGNAAKTLIRGPGINNWNAAVFKNFPLKESLKLQFRCELYNAFNHTQFSGVDNAARFDPATGAQVNARFGEFTAARDARIIQMALRVSF